MDLPIALSIAAFVIVIGLVLLYLSVRVVQQYERMVVFRLGQTNERMVRGFRSAIDFVTGHGAPATTDLQAYE